MTVTFVKCENCGTYGTRVRTSPAYALHPGYASIMDFHCAICGSRLRLARHREYHDAIMRGADVGA